MLHSPFPIFRRTSDDAHAFLWSGEFRDHRLERRYREERIEMVRAMLRACGLAGTGMFVLLIGRDWLVHGPGTVFYWNLAIRLIALLGGVAFQVAIAKARTVWLLDIVAALGMAAFSLLLFLTWILVSPPGMNAGAVSFAILLVYYLLLPSPAVVNIANAVLLTIGAVAITVAWADAPAENLYALTLFLLIGNGLGVIGMRRFKLERRRTYLAQEEARRVTRSLTLARQESRWRSEYQAWALDALQVGVVLVDPDGRLHTVNRRAAELLAVPPELIRLGDPYEDLMKFLIRRGDFGSIDVDDAQFHIDRLLHGLATTVPVRFRSTGKVLEFTGGQLPDRSVAISIFDATERHALNRRLRHSVEVAGDGFAIYDVNDRVVICSSRFAALYGLTVDQAIGMTFDELIARANERGVFDPVERGAGGLAVAHLGRRRVPERLFEMRTMTGEWFLVHERITPSGDLVVLRTNITSRRRIEDELRRAKDEAEKALAELRETQASLVLAEKMASLGSLVAGMSHEISTPLGIGVSAASHLGDEMAKLTGQFRAGQLKRSELEDFLESAGEATRIMQGNLARAARLIQAFKQVSADQTADEIRSFDIGEYLREIMLSLAPALRRAPHKVDIDCPPGLTIRNRPGAFGQIVTNLVMNAVQHAFEGRAEPGMITIRVQQPRPGRIVIEFSDNGHGIATEFLPKVFDPFFTTRRGTGGTGLGLHIVYNLVTQVLGGAIAVSSREGEGTRFTISFPLDAKN